MLDMQKQKDSSSQNICLGKSFCHSEQKGRGTACRAPTEQGVETPCSFLLFRAKRKSTSPTLLLYFLTYSQITQKEQR